MKKRKRDIKYFNDEQVKMFFDVVKDKRDYALFLLFYKLGGRVSEIVSLRLSDLLPDQSNIIKIKVNRVKDGISREIPLTADDVKTLKKWLRERAKFKNAKGNE